MWLILDSAVIQSQDVFILTNNLYLSLKFL